MVVIAKLWQLILVVGLITSASLAAAAAAEAMPGCPHKCGDVDIPYPFGTQKGCYLNDDFFINCSHSSPNTAPTPYLRKGNLPVANISIEGEIRVLSRIAKDCYFKNGSRDNQNSPSLWTSRNLYISDTKNKFVAVGCDTYAFLRSSKGRGENYTTGCMSICNSYKNVPNNSCSGEGCCEVSIPKGIGEITITLGSWNNHTNVLNFNLCSYAFVVEENAFKFSASNLRNLQNITRLPMVLDWAVGNETCRVAQQNKASYACKENSDCIPSTNGPGYLCKCYVNYDGNPYLHGCKDIDECENGTHECERKEYCINKSGSHECKCPKDYSGDGMKDKKGCTRNRKAFPVIQLALGIGIGVIILLLGITWIYFVYHRRNLIKLKEKFFKQNGGFMLQQKLSTSHDDRSTKSTKIFTAEELKKATDNYDESRIIGQGGFGTVYKGFLADKSVVAIKKSKIVDQSQNEQFINEVVVLSQINHRNVVRLLGCCLETEVPLLVYEFVPNGTLFEHIHDTNNNMKSPLTWDTRLRIAAETAGVLSYMHSAAYIPIIHRDVKSTNILLDDTYTAKVSDFGTSRLVPTDEDGLSTMVQGTLGYLDPEYLQTNQLTDKSDVYSFGVVLVELLTGRKALSFDRPEYERSLAMQFLIYLKEDRLFQVLEEGIVTERNIDHLKEVSNLAKRCLGLKGNERPTMKEVAMELEGMRVMMGRDRPWSNDNVELNSAETLLIEASSNSLGDSGSANISSTYDSIRNHVTLAVAVADGR